MAENELEATSSLLLTLSNSFRRVPPDSIPAVLDCLLDSTALSPATLFSSLLNSSPDFAKDLSEGDEVATFVAALCHLLKKLGPNHDAMKLFIWRTFLPLMNALHTLNRELLNQVAESFTVVVVETSSWKVLDANLVPFLLRSVHHSLGALQHEKLETGIFGHLGEEKEHSQYPTWFLPLPISCHILALMLDVALSNQKINPISDSIMSNGCINSERFAGNLIWSLCSMAECMLPQSLEHRSCAISFLLPIIFKAFASFHSFDVLVDGKKIVFSRNNFFVKIWKCCRALFSLGPIERRDAYSVLSLYLSFLPCTDVSGDSDDMCDNVEGLDITTDLEFWDQIREGLIDKESLVRKQSLQMLKTAVHFNQGRRSVSVAEATPHRRRLIPPGMTKREAWAEIEAKSLGVGQICNPIEPSLNSQQKWEAFVLLYEMLDEYGTHLVEAAWNHQVSLLLDSSTSHVSVANSDGVKHPNLLETSSEIFTWLTILWERGLHHDNPQVRCLIMQSILGIKWKNYGNFSNSVPDSFVLGSFLQALNDPVHHKEFGLKGVYSSETIEGARQFLCSYANCLGIRRWVGFLNNLASAPKHQSLSRVGLMSLAECIASTACRVEMDDKKNEVEKDEDLSQQNDRIVLLDSLRFVIESSKQHFNPNYRLRVCEKILEAGASVTCTVDLPLEVLLHFISTFPREFTDYGGSLRAKVQRWLTGCGKNQCPANCSNIELTLPKSLHDFPSKFTIFESNEFTTYDDEDIEAWESEARRWARVLFLAIKEECHLIPIWMFLQKQGFEFYGQNKNLEHAPVKFLILISSLVLELQIMQERTAEYSAKFRTRSESDSLETLEKLSYDASTLYLKFTEIFLSFMEEMVSFANLSCSIFSSNMKIADNLPGSVKGKLGGPSQRRLSSSTTTAVLKAVTSVKTVALISSWCAQFECGNTLHTAFKFLWKFYWNTISSSACDSETEAEMCLAAYEALSCALKALVSVFSPQTLDYFSNNDNQSLSKVGNEPLLDIMVLAFLYNINNLVGTGVLVRTRRAVLMNWKWLCLESLLSVPGYAVKNGVHLVGNDYFFSDSALRQIFNDLVENLENAGEGSLLPMLRSVRLSLDLFASGKLGLLVSSCNGVEYQTVWNLVRSSWILHASCNKRKVAPIAALLSSILHSSLFADETMHTTDDTPGPLKWFVGKVLEEGTKSPRTIRLAALHLSGLWLSDPKFIKYYTKELKLLSLYGSIAFDEDFEGELAENHDTQIEVSLLAKSPDPELSEAFINTELYARVSVAVLFYKLANLADMVGSQHAHRKCQAALESGKLFLLELLDAAVKDKDLAKELYKKYSAIHRRKIRAWQMICVLSRFVCQDIVGPVSEYLHLSLSRNNLPAVRQYLETFAINTFLKFPSLVEEQLVPILRDYDMKPQALASYVFIAANVILHASKEVQSKHLDDLLPPIVPLLTSHHHSLRGFTQLLVYQVLSRFFPPSNLKSIATAPLEKRCFEDMKMYLSKNTDCARLRVSMEGYLDAYSPTLSVTPAGIFVNRVEQLEFECVPKSLMEELLTFLNDVREDLRSSMAKDVVTIKNETLRSGEDHNPVEVSSKDRDGNMVVSQPTDVSFDFQKKITLYKHEKQDNDSSSFLCYDESYKQLLEIEKEDLLLDHLLQSRSLQMEKFRSSRQQFIMVASLVDRIPNLAGLARTCEVFKALGLAVPDANIIHDKQFQLISVTADRWVPISEVPVDSMKVYLEKKKKEGYSILGLEQTANSIPLDKYQFPKKTVLVLGREKEGIPVDIINILDACIEIPQLGVVRSLNVHVSGAIALWEYTRQQRS